MRVFPKKLGRAKLDCSPLQASMYEATDKTLAFLKKVKKKKTESYKMVSGYVTLAKKVKPNSSSKELLIKIT